jgi:hypothetical protein
VREIDGIRRNNLHERTLKRLRVAKPWQPDILLVQGDSGPAVVKDYKPRPYLYRVFVGLVSVWNEVRMYEKLSGIPGIPRCHGKLDRYAIVVEYIPGRNGSEVKAGEVKRDFFIKLKTVVDQVHARGVVLCDLRNRKNVLITDRLDPYIIDLTTAFQRGGRWNLPKNFLYDLFHQDDLLGIAKLKKKLAPELLSDDEAQKLSSGLFLQREAMAVRDFCVRWLKKLVDHEHR